MEKKTNVNLNGRYITSETAEYLYELSGIMDIARHVSVEFEDKYSLNDNADTITKAPPIWEIRKIHTDMYYDMWIINDYLYRANDLIKKLLDTPIYNPVSEGGAV